MADPNPNPNASVESDSDEGLGVFPPDNKFPPGLICPFCGRNQTKKVSNPRVRCRRCDAHLGMVATLQKWRDKNWRQQCTCGQRPTIEVMLSRAAYKCNYCPSKWSVDSSLARWEEVKQQRRRRRGKAQPPASSTTTTDDELHRQQEVEESSGMMEDEDESIGVMEKLQMEDEDESIGVMEDEDISIGVMEKLQMEMTALRLENERLIQENISLRIENEIITENRNYLREKLITNAQDIGRAINAIYSLRNTCYQE